MNSGGWGYAPRYRALKAELDAEFDAGDIYVTGTPSKTTTGEFEVIVNGTLIHSKLKVSALTKPTKTNILWLTLDQHQCLLDKCDT